MQRETGCQIEAGSIFSQHVFHDLITFTVLQLVTCILVVQVPFARSSLNHDDVFILDTENKIYQFNGANSNIQERAKALEVIQFFKDKYHEGKCDVAIVGKSTCINNLLMLASLLVLMYSISEQSSFAFSFLTFVIATLHSLT